MAAPKQEKKIIGLTGNLACGKSTVARLLRELGVVVVDADAVSREVTAPGAPLLKKIASAFGVQVLSADGALDRAKLRELAFQNDDNRKKLEAILHPAIRKRSQTLFEQAFEQGAPAVVYEAALLIETGQTGDFAGILLVTCLPAHQLERAQARDATLSPELARKMLAAQTPQPEKIRQATWVLENNGTVEELRVKVRNWAVQNGLAKAKRP